MCRVIPERTRHFATYTPERIASVVAMQREVNPGTHDELIADLSAVVLTGGQGDELATDHASEQVMRWMRGAR